MWKVSHADMSASPSDEGREQTTFRTEPRRAASSSASTSTNVATIEASRMQEAGLAERDYGGSSDCRGRVE